MSNLVIQPSLIIEDLSHMNVYFHCLSYDVDCHSWIKGVIFPQQAQEMVTRSMSAFVVLLVIIFNNSPRMVGKNDNTSYCYYHYCYNDP